MKEKYYVTTPIYYINSEPHRFAYTTIVADVVSNTGGFRLTMFLSDGDHEHGQKVLSEAVSRKMDTEIL